MKYVVNENSRYWADHIDNAQEIGDWLARLPNKTTEGIFEASKDEDSPLHKYVWELTDKQAAREYRLSRVRQLVANIMIEAPSGPLRAFESVTLNDVRQYVGIGTIAEAPDLIDQVIENALKELSYWKLKHQGILKFFGELPDVITKVEETYRSKREESKQGHTRGKGKRKRKARNPSNQEDAREYNNNRRVTAAR